MKQRQKHWFQKWFNKDYLLLYADRDPKEAMFQVDFLIKELNLHGKERILDLGCGALRHTIALAKRGFSVTGVDLSQVLIDEGKKELNKFDHLHVKLIVGDMFSLKNVGVFDVVINMFTSFGYFSDDKENVKVFERVSKWLLPGGKFFLDYLHPWQVEKNLKPFEVKEIAGQRVEITKKIAGDQIVKKIVFCSSNKQYEEKVKLYKKEQIEAMLQKHHLQVCKVWNDYTGNPWREKGDRQLFYSVLH